MKIQDLGIKRFNIHRAVLFAAPWHAPYIRTVSYGTVWHGMVWNSMKWYGMEWFGPSRISVWYGMVTGKVLLVYQGVKTASLTPLFPSATGL